MHTIYVDAISVSRVNSNSVAATGEGIDNEQDVKSLGKDGVAFSERDLIAIEAIAFEPNLFRVCFESILIRNWTWIFIRAFELAHGTFALPNYFWE